MSAPSAIFRAFSFARLQKLTSTAPAGLAFNSQSLTALGPLAFGTAVAPSLSQPVLAGTGATIGRALPITAQPGQQQAGGAANNNGGDLQLSSGPAGTGGSGAAALPGAIVFTLGTFTVGKLQTLTVPDARFTVDPGAAGFVFAANGSGQALTFQALTAGSVAFQCSQAVFADSTPLPVATWTLAHAGVSGVNIASTVTSFSWIQNTLTSGTGAPTSFLAQSVTTGTGGDFSFGPGAGSTAPGALKIPNVVVTTTATAGALAAIPALPAAYMSITVAGVARKIVLYNP